MLYSAWTEQFALHKTQQGGRVMSRTLNLCQHLLAQGRRFHRLGADQHALRTLTRLARLRELPSPIAEEAQGRLAELFLKQGKFARARRHLAAALAHRP